MIKSRGPIFVHSDVGRGILAAKRAGAEIKGGHLQDSLMAFLAQHADTREAGLLFPAFNYDYGKTRVFDVDNDLVQVGALPEWVRRNREFQRSEIPFFSFLSKGNLHLDTNGIINPFGRKSGFQWLVDHDATLMLFGAHFSTLTFIHYVEEVSGKPVYRYDKNFPGEIVRKGQSRPCDLVMHVRPRGAHMDYDWPRLEQDLLEASLIHLPEYTADIKWLSARKILEFWGNKLADDPFYLVDGKTRTYFEAATDGGRTRIKIEDYEDG